MRLGLVLGAGLLLAATGTEAQTRPKPKGNVNSWVRNDDYPKAALRQRLSGIVSFVLYVSKEGMPTRCEVTTNTPAILNERTCELMMARARFYPATDAAGQPVDSDYRSRAVWEVPHD